MATYFDGNRQIISVDTSVSAERFFDILVRAFAVNDVMILLWIIIMSLWARPNPAFCLSVLGAHFAGTLLFLTQFVPTQNIGFARYLYGVSDVGTQLLGWSLLITLGSLMLAIAIWGLQEARRLTRR